MTRVGGDSGTRSGSDTRVVRNFLTLGAGELLSRLIGFIGTIWIARQLGVDAYGVIGFAFAVLLYFGAVGDLGMEQLGPREVAEDRVPLAVLAASMLYSRLIASALISAIMVGIGLVAMQAPDGVVLALFGLTLLPMGANMRWAHIGLENVRVVSISRLVIEAVRVSLLLAFVHGPDDLFLVPVAQIAGEAVGTLLLLVALARRGVRLWPRIDTVLVRAVLRRGMPLLFTNLLALVIYNADVVLLRVFRGRTEVGLYLAAYTLINFLGVLGNTATLSILPSFSRLRSAADRGIDLFQSAMAQVTAIGLPVAVGGAMLAPSIITSVFGAEYAESALILRILIISIPLLLLRSVLQAALIAAGRQNRVLHTTAWAAAVTGIMDLALIPPFGLLGAAVATVTAELTRLVAARHYASPEGYTGPGGRRLASPAIAAGIMAAALFLLQATPLWISVPTGALVYAAMLFATGGLLWTDGTIRISV